MFGRATTIITPQKPSPNVLAMSVAMSSLIDFQLCCWPFFAVIIVVFAIAAMPLLPVRTPSITGLDVPRSMPIIGMVRMGDPLFHGIV